jgi:hypothetical protein
MAKWERARKLSSETVMAVPLHLLYEGDKRSKDKAPGDDT